MMTLDRLRTFTIAAEELNFTQAARRLGLSQPAISLQIKELEESLKVSLFERTGRKLILTPAGERLRPRALAILRSVEEADGDLATFRSACQGVLRIGASTTLGIYLLPFALGAFSKLYPGVRASLQVNEADAVIRDLMEHHIELALVEEDIAPGRIHGYDKVPLLEDELVLITSPEHPWAESGQAALAELERASFILRPSESPIRQLIHDQLSRAGLDPQTLQISFELNHSEGIKRAVMAGLGVGFVSRAAITRELAAGWLQEIRVPGLKIARTFWSIRPTADKLTANQQRFCEMLHAQAWLPSSLNPLVEA